MARTLDLADIQGNVLRAYPFPKARFIFLHIDESSAGREVGRAFIKAIRPKITTALPWQSSQPYPKGPTGHALLPKPKVTFNIALNFYGLLAIGLPTTTLRGLPAEFIDGMAARARILGDDFQGAAPNRRDPIWLDQERANKVHILISLFAQMNPDGTPVAELEEATKWVFDQCEASGGALRVLKGHGRADEPYQEASALLVRQPSGGFTVSPKEHFGLTDGLGDPVFEGQYPPEAEKDAAVGGGKILPDQSWAPLATGEFLIGYPDEAQETAPAAMPLEFTHNGTFMAYRKLHQNVGSFEDFIARTAVDYAKVNAVPDLAAAREIVTAKIVGRWSDGVPLLAAATFDEWQAFRVREAAARASGDAQAIAAIERAYVDFKYRDDPGGAKCPVSAHLRRANTRDMLDPTGSSPDPKLWNGSVLNNRRRILRRGLPYGGREAPGDAGEQGIIFLALCASLYRQYEFLQQQWMQYGLDFNVGNDTCPLIGNHQAGAKYVIAGDPQTGTQPFVASNLPQFVEMRGGDYFFVPSITAIEMMGLGIVDPT